MSTIEQIRERIRRNAELCKLVYRDAVRRGDVDNGFVGYLKTLINKSVPPGVHRSN